MRAFLAIPLPTGLCEELAEVARGIDGLRAQRPESIHLTVRFLGDTLDAEAVAGAVAPVAAKHEPFDMTLERIGVFPKRGTPRVCWVGLGEGEIQAGALVAGVEEALEPLGFPRERRPWHGHVTLGRFRSRVNPKRVVDHERTFATVRAERLVLYKSTLRPEGAVHDAVREFPLGARGPG